MSIKIGDTVTWVDSNKHLKNRNLRGIVKNIVDDVAIVQRGDLAHKLRVSDLTLDGSIVLTRDEYRKNIYKVVNDMGLYDADGEAIALRNLANDLFEQLEIALFGESANG